MASKATCNLTYGLFVVTAKDGERDNGCITNTVGQVTTSPNRITLAVNKGNFTHDMIVKTGAFNASILSQAAGFDIFKNFGFQSGRDVDKFAAFGDVERSENGLYYVTKGANSFISASVVNSWDVGTHTLFLADVTAQAVLNGTASMSYDYYQTYVKPLPKKASKTVWRCKVCGYEYEGEELPADFTCPTCKHGAEDFEKIEAK